MAANPDFTQAVVDALQRSGKTRIRIQGRSMYPILRHGAQVIVEPTAYDELAPGDLIVFYDGRGIVCHRLIRKAQRRCYLKGDTNTWADPPVSWPQVLGRVTHVIEAEGKMRPIALDSQRRQAVLVARFSYWYALYFNVLHWLGQCRWWTRSREDQSSEDTEDEK
jgi:signal peptidase I